MVRRIDPDEGARVEYDEVSLVVAASAAVEFESDLRALQAENTAEATGHLRAWLRWKIDEFADLVMRPVLERTGTVSDQNEIDDFILRPRPLRVGHRHATTRRLLMTGRGVGKTTRLKIRALHGLLYGATRVAVAIGATDEEAQGWIKTIREWLENPEPLLRELFPELRIHSTEHLLRVETRFGRAWLLARSFTGGLRGLNVHAHRPDALYLDDVEGEDKSVTVKARDRNQIRISKKILPLVPLEGGAEIWWVQTPVHHDCVAVRVWKGHPEMQGWTCRRIPVVRRWPEGTAAERLWADNRAIFFDVDRFGDDERARTEASREHYLANRAAMSAGAIVLDEARLPLDAAYRLRWSIGEMAWGTEYEVRTGRPGSSTFSPDTWPRFERLEDRIRIHGREVSILGMQLAAHYDPSDGGDDGALVVVGKHGGRWYVLAVYQWETSRLSVQIAAIPDAIRPYVALGLSSLQWEPTTGAASVVEGEILDALHAAGVEVDLVGRHSTERKEARIVATLEPKAAGGLLAIPDDLSDRVEAQIADFQPGQRDNRDDILDALQRAVEITETGSDGEPSAQDVLAILRRLR